MGRLDELKESLNTLRVSLSLLVGFLLVVSGGLIAKYERGDADFLFWSGIFIAFASIVAIGIVFSKIVKKTKEIGEL